MQLTPDHKAVILNYLKDGQREMAVQYVSKLFHTSHYDSQALVETVSREFSHELKSVAPKSGKGCSGCLTSLLKVISILLLIASAGIFTIGYFFIDLFGNEWNNRQVPVVISGFVNPYADTAYAYAYLIYQFENEGQIRVDTTNIDYHTDYNQIGDTIKLTAKELGLPLDAETISRMNAQQEFIYSIGGTGMLAAVIFWMVTAVFKIRPPSTEGGRYSK